MRTRAALPRRTISIAGATYTLYAIRHRRSMCGLVEEWLAEAIPRSVAEHARRCTAGPRMPSCGVGEKRAE